MAREWTPEKIGEWNKKVFGRGEIKDNIGILNHLRREVSELIHGHYELCKEPTDEFAKKALSLEVADVQILLDAYAYGMGIDVDKAVDHKMFINENRKWKEPDSEGVMEHES